MPEDKPHRWLIYSDMDGSLLDHYTYSHAAADATLAACDALNFPVICCTSKTRAELLDLRQELHNTHPFIVENGAAIFIPKGYFAKQPDDTVERNGFWVKEFCQSRQHWLQLLDQAPTDLRQPLMNFARMGNQGVADATGLPLDRATLANNREYSEPALWQGDKATATRLIEWLTQAGARIQQGGRFLHITDQCDKGLALQWLTQKYQAEDSGTSFYSLAIGDSHNDVAMLEVADYALVIRSPVHEPPTLQRPHNVYLSTAPGPVGWVEGVKHFIPACQQQGHNNS